TSLHPDLLEPLAQLIADASQRTQLWVVTHSQVLARHLESYGRCAPRQVHMVDGETRIRGLSLAGRFADDADEDGNDEAARAGAHQRHPRDNRPRACSVSPCSVAAQHTRGSTSQPCAPPPRRDPPRPSGQPTPCPVCTNRCLPATPGAATCGWRRVARRAAS